MPVPSSALTADSCLVAAGFGLRSVLSEGPITSVGSGSIAGALPGSRCAVRLPARVLKPTVLVTVCALPARLV